MTNAHAIILTRLDIDADRLDEALGILAEMTVDVVTNEPGTVYYRFYQDLAHPTTIWALEVFEDAAAKATHLERHTHRVAQFQRVLRRSVMNELVELELS